VEGLPDEVVRAVLHRLDGRLHIAEGRDDEDRDLWSLLLDAPQDLDTRDPRHLDVRDDEVELFRREKGEPLLPVLRRRNLVADPAEIEEGDFPPRIVVVDEENAPCRAFSHSGPLQSIEVKTSRRDRMAHTSGAAYGRHLFVSG
jgi:hypothetical protein